MFSLYWMFGAIFFFCWVGGVYSLRGKSVFYIWMIWSQKGHVFFWGWKTCPLLWAATPHLLYVSYMMLCLGTVTETTRVFICFRTCLIVHTDTMFMHSKGQQVHLRWSEHKLWKGHLMEGDVLWHVNSSMEEAQHGVRLLRWWSFEFSSYALAKMVHDSFVSRYS